MEIKKKRIGRTGLEVDILGLGCAPLGGNFVDLGYNDAAKIIKKAISEGISYFDFLLR
jgi:D-threo-aldose 1-dehydrogenase